MGGHHKPILPHRPHEPGIVGEGSNYRHFAGSTYASVGRASMRAPVGHLNRIAAPDAVPASRRAVFEQIRVPTTKACPFVNLAETVPGRWGEGLTAEKMMGCVWLTPEAVAQVEFLEWTGGEHLRHTKFIGLRDDKDPCDVVKES
jgi:hypothetical protein